MITSDQIESLDKIQLGLKQGVFSCIELVGFYLDRIEDSAFTNAYVDVFKEESLERAEEVDKLLKSEKAPHFSDVQNDGSQLGKLFGLIISVKDLICIEGKQISASSIILSNYKSPFNATAISRLLDEGVIIIGTTNCDEFGMGSANENSCHGAVRHFTHSEYVSGGSSGGSAVSVQADTCLISLGTDTGGSVRQPAAFCGVFGLKPSYGLISRYGLIAYASSFDQLGLFGKNIDDISKVLSVVAGVDEKDSTTVALKRDLTKNSLVEKGGDDFAKFKVAVLEEALNTEGLQEEIKTGLLKVMDDLQHANHKVVKVSFPLLKSVVPAYYILTTAEASSNLSRYDGVRYGYRSEKGKDLEDMYRHTRSEGFGKEVKRRIMLGTFVLSSGYYDAYFTRAQKVRRLISEQLEAILNEHHVIILPTTPTTAWKIGEKNQDPVSVYLADIFTVIANLCGLPAISVPLGHDEKGLPFGLQIIGRRFEEDQLLQFAARVRKL